MPLNPGNSAFEAVAVGGSFAAPIPTMADAKPARTNIRVGTWVITPAGTRGVVDHVYEDNVNDKGRLMQVDVNILPGGSRITQVNVREADLRIAPNQSQGW